MDGSRGRVHARTVSPDIRRMVLDDERYIVLFRWETVRRDFSFLELVVVWHASRLRSKITLLGSLQAVTTCVATSSSLTLLHFIRLRCNRMIRYAFLQYET